MAQVQPVPAIEIKVKPDGRIDVFAGTVDVGLSRLSKVLERARVLKGTLRDALIAMVKANELAGRTDVALVYLRELMMHTKDVQQENALLHHRLHLEQLEQKQQPASSPDSLLAKREVKLRGMANSFYRERISQAKRRLVETADAIKEIAQQTGYSDRFFFSKDFKRLTGHAPREFRQREQSKRGR